jgi:ribosome-interacting GTPase 1
MDGPRVFSLARNADGLLLMVDLTRNPAEQLTLLKSELQNSNIILDKAKGEVQVQRRAYGSGITLMGSGQLIDCSTKDIKNLLQSYRINSALVKIVGPVRLEEVESALFSENIYKPSLVIANKTDLAGHNLDLSHLSKIIGDTVPIISFSCRKPQGKKRIGEAIFQILQIARIYTKTPSDKASSNTPVIIKKGSTVTDVSKKLHSRLYKNLRYARVWGESAKYPGQKVGSDHILQDGDIIELH